MIYEDGYEVSKLNDKVNDEAKIMDVIDWDSRDNVFVYIDGQIFKGISGESHSDVIHRLLNETGSRLRLSDEEVKKKLKTNDVAFGHIINNCAFIDFPTVGANINNVVNACQGFDKVYLYEKICNYPPLRRRSGELRSFQSWQRFPHRLGCRCRPRRRRGLSDWR